MTIMMDKIRMGRTGWVGLHALLATACWRWMPWGVCARWIPLFLCFDSGRFSAALRVLLMTVHASRNLRVVYNEEE